LTPERNSELELWFHRCLLTKLFQNVVPVKRVSSVSKEAPMLESEKFRRYAKDCIRIASTMNGQDRQTLLAIAEAWEARAAEAEGRQHKTNGEAGPEAPSVIPDGGA
jgi:hypothetical protein